MEAILLNSDLEIIGQLDVFKSFLWADRYDEYGDFEIILFPKDTDLTMISQCAYIILKESDHLMILEYVNIRINPVTGKEIILKGKSLESILQRRIIWTDTILTGNFQDAIALILNDNAINPTDTDRKITKLEFLASTNPIITALTIDNETIGENLYSVISTLCKINNIGFKITLTDLGKFQFQLYAGEDRSYDQSSNPYIVFSPNFDNFTNGEYLISTENLKTTALVAGEIGVENVRTFATAASVEGTTDLDRREIFVDATNITRNVPDQEEPLTEEEYLVKLENKGLEELRDQITVENFSGEVESQGEYKFGEDFFMGDILQVSDDYGHEGKSRIIEMIYFQDPGTIKMAPTFSAIY